MEPSFKVLFILNLVLLSLSLLVLKASEVRPYLYYGLVAAMAVILFIQIMAFRQDRKRALFILPQIMVLGLSVIWSMTLKYYYYIGRTDVLGHAWLAENLLKNGHVTDIFGMYQGFPLWHTLSVALYTISGLPVSMNQIMYLASGLVYFVMPLAVYLVTRRLCASYQVSLLCALIIALNSDVLISGMYSIARSVEPLFLAVLLLIFLADRAINKKETLGMLALALGLTLVIIVFHTVSIGFILILLGAIYVLQTLLVRGTGTSIVSGKYLAASLVMAVAYWFVFAPNLTAQLTSMVFTPTPKTPMHSSVLMPFNELFNYLQYIPLLLFVILGILIVLGSQKFGREAKLISIATLLLIPLSFPGPIIIIEKLGRDIDMSRFSEYTFIFLGIMAAMGLAVFYRRNSRQIKALCIVIFAAWVLFSVSNDFVASDNPLVKRPFYTSYLTQNEVTSINTVMGITSVSAGYTLSDYVFARYIEFSDTGRQYPSKPMVLEVYAPGEQMIKSSDRDIVLIRQQELDKRPLRMVSLKSPRFIVDTESYGLTYYTGDDEIFRGLGRMSQVYNSSAVQGYI